MLPKIASALARVLEPIQPVDRPGETLATSKSPEGGEGGHGPLGYSGPENQEEEKQEFSSESTPEEVPPPEDEALRIQTASDPEPETVSLLQKKGPSLQLQPGLTQVILDLSTIRQEQRAEGNTPTSGTSLTSYEVRAKEQKKASRLPKGSMLDKKAG